MWIKYTDSEVSVYHPICEKALKDALKLLKLDKKYKVVHHQAVGNLEMDFAICNKTTGKYLCVIEVKRTKSAVESTRYQYQAMSYVQMADKEMEKPFYILTNLEYSYIFRYDSSKSRVVQQILEPGLILVDKFSNCSNKDEFINKLIEFYKEILSKFITNEYIYSTNINEFEQYMIYKKSHTKEWKSSLAILLYEYIRGAFVAVNRYDLNDVRKYKNDVKVICDEASKINFKEIFNYDKVKFLDTVKVENALLTNMYKLGNKNVSADGICNVLHSIASDGNEHSKGEVATDVELSVVLSILAKFVYGNKEIQGIVCDPAAGSGTLISSAIDVLNLKPNQVMANDIEPYLLELLSLRLGLSFPKTINKTNCPVIYNNDIADMSSKDFKNVSVVLLNPPYIAGINCVNEKKKLAVAIQKNTGKPAITYVGQAGLQSIFIEMVNSLVKDDTIIACIIPKQDLTATGKEAREFRKYLVEHFGLQVIFNYPGEKLFSAVTKDTCIVVGKKGSSEENIKVFSCLDTIQEIDISEFSDAIGKNNLLSGKFSSIAPGIEGIQLSRRDLINSLDDGWRMLNGELAESIEFVNNELSCSSYLTLSESFGIKRGKVQNKGGSNLLYLSSNKELYKKYRSNISELKPGMRNATLNNLIVGKGDTEFLHYQYINKTDLDRLISDYLLQERAPGKQLKKQKTLDELKNLLEEESKNITKENSVLIPRDLRRYGRVYITNEETYVSTNFAIIQNKDIRNANIFASWISTIFYQLNCEVLSKDQEGARKMEMTDIKKTYLPNPKIINDEKYNELVKIIPHIKFLDLQEPEIREVDIYWANILYGSEGRAKLDEAQRLLKFIARKRNQIN